MIVPCPRCGSPNANDKNTGYSLPTPEAIAAAENKPTNKLFDAGTPGASASIGFTGALCKNHSDALAVSKERGGELGEKLVWREILLCEVCKVTPGLAEEKKK